MAHLRPALILAPLLIACTQTAPKAPKQGCIDNCTEATNEYPEELGIVRWERNFDHAKAKAVEQGKPLFVLFDEVPGCSTVKGFGSNVLSDPLIAEVIESSFVPVVIYNNVGGNDEAILDSFDEPSWNNPVVRIFSPSGEEIVKRFAGPYTKHALSRTMELALAKSPTKGLSDPTTSNTRKGYLSMYCFWTGEVKLGALNGVVETRPGFMNGSEVVEVTYDPNKMSFEDLSKQAKASGAATGAYVTSDAEKQIAKKYFSDVETASSFRFSEKDDKYQIRNTKLRKLDLTPYQLTKVNAAAVSATLSVSDFLTPAQRKALKRN